jgi:hypothetical protein
VKSATEQGGGTIQSDAIKYYDFQFAVQYLYEDNQLSVLSPYSILCARNQSGETYKRVRVSVNTSEAIPALVKELIFCARINNTGSFYIVGRVKKSGGSFPQTYVDFYNTSNGGTIAQRYEQQFEPVPLVSKAMAFVKNRLWLGNNKEGYDAPSDINMAVETVETSVGVSDVTAPMDVFSINEDDYDWVATTRAYSLYNSSATEDPFTYTFNGGAQGATVPARDTDLKSYRLENEDVNDDDFTYTLNGETQYGVVPKQTGPNPGQVTITADDGSISGTGALTTIFDLGYVSGAPGTITIIADPGSISGTAAGTTVVDLGLAGGFWENTPAATPKGYNVKKSDNLWYAVNAYPGTPPYTLAGTGFAYTDNITYTGSFDVLGAPIPSHKFVYTATLHASGVSIKIGTTASQDVFIGQLTYSNNSTHKLGIVFKDEHGRACGVVTKASLKIDIPEAWYPQVRIKWELLDDLNIPSWAKYYSVVMTKNLRKNYFLEYRTLDIFYSKTSSAGVESRTYVYSPDNQYLKVDVSGLIFAGFEYAFVEGDRIFLRSPDGAGNFDLKIVGFDGQYVICDNTDITADGTLPTEAKVIFEIYRPVKNYSDILFYEYGQTYEIIREPLSGVASFSQKVGIFDGDTVNVLRPDLQYNSGEIEDSGTDTLYKTVVFDRDEDGVFIWNSNIGKPYIETLVGQVTEKSTFRFSGNFIADTAINELSEFNSTDKETVPVENGAIMRLQGTTAAETDGDMLLAICENDTSSIYLDETRVSFQATNSFAISSRDVIGDVRTPRRGFGTLHPESVFEYNGHVFWYDQINRAYIRYAPNGMVPISEIKAVHYFEDQGNTHPNVVGVIGGYDPFYKVVLATFPAEPTAERRTIMFSEPGNRWIGFLDIQPDAWFAIDEKLYSAKAGSVYSHNSTTYNNFYGSQKSGKIALSFNDGVAVPKRWRSFSAHVSPSLITWSGGDQAVVANALSVRVDTPYGQWTDVTAARMEVDNSVVYGALLKDITSPGGLLSGDDLVSGSCQLTITVNSAVLAWLFFVQMGYQEMIGHKM